MTENEVLPYVNTANGDSQRAQWPTDDGYLFVKILAEHAECSGKQGLKLNHCPIDMAVIDEVAVALANNVDVGMLAQSLAAKYPNKKLEGRSADSINLLISFKQHIPQFTYRQHNHKHTNFCTRTIIPFQDIFNIGRPFKSKNIFDKVCKRFVKVIIEFYSHIISFGIHSVDLNLYARKSGSNSKQLDQWLTAMLNTHKQNMVGFLFACGVKLATSYIKSKRPESHTYEETRFLEAQSFPPKIVLMILREYLDHIAKHDVDDAMLGMSVTQTFKELEQQEGTGNDREQYSPEAEYRAPHASVSVQQPAQSPIALQQPIQPPAAAQNPGYSYRPREDPRYQPYPRSRQAAYAAGARRPSIGNEMQHAYQSPRPELYGRQYGPIRTHPMQHPAYMSQHAMPPMKPVYAASQAPGRVSYGAEGPGSRQQPNGYYRPMLVQRGPVSPSYGYRATAAARPPPTSSASRFHPYAQPAPTYRQARAYESVQSTPQALPPQLNSNSMSPQTMPTDVQSQPDTKATSVPATPISSIKPVLGSKPKQAENCDIHNELETLRQLFGNDTKKHKQAAQDPEPAKPDAASDCNDTEPKSISISSLLS
ncbi:hypothetical protein EV183_004670 [Coemansia sp. RSA 2336]|nr:hypothetical protein EV183_004670 [Coemansia sp. RSA 2336]